MEDSSSEKEVILREESKKAIQSSLSEQKAFYWQIQPFHRRFRVWPIATLEDPVCIIAVNGIARLGRASQDSAMTLEITMTGHNSISTPRT